MNKYEDISINTGSKENVVQAAQQVAPVTANAQHVCITSTMSVDQLMQAAFFNGRTPRSAEYKAGTRAVLENRIERKDIIPPYQAGTTEADAYFAGIEEGKSIWRAAVAKIGGQA